MAQKTFFFSPQCCVELRQVKELLPFTLTLHIILQQLVTSLQQFTICYHADLLSSLFWHRCTIFLTRKGKALAFVAGCSSCRWRDQTPLLHLWLKMRLCAPLILGQMSMSLAIWYSGWDVEARSIWDLHLMRPHQYRQMFYSVRLHCQSHFLILTPVGVTVTDRSDFAQRKRFLMFAK